MTDFSKIGPITYERALSTLREIVAGREDYVYEKVEDSDGSACVYFNHGQPSCIVGHAMARWGIEPSEVESHPANYASIGSLNLATMPFADRESARLFGLVQELQDSGYAWGVALDRAVEYVRVGRPR